MSDKTISVWAALLATGMILSLVWLPAGEFFMGLAVGFSLRGCIKSWLEA